MDVGLAEEYSQPLPLLGIYSSPRSQHNYWAVAFLLICLCASSLFLSYYFYNKLHFSGKKSWTRAIYVLSPIRKRLQNLEKERAIWKYYLHWMEDYFFVYCDLLKFLNKTTLDVEKVYKDYMLGLSQVASCGIMSESSANMSKISGIQSCSSLESIPSEDDLQLISSLPRVFAQIASDDIVKGRSNEVKPIFDSYNLFTSDATSGDETNEEFNENESATITVPREAFNRMELMDMEFLREETKQDEGLFQLSDCGTGIDFSEQ